MKNNSRFVITFFSNIYYKILCLCCSLSMTAIVQQSHAQNFVIGGISYIPCFPSETVVAPFTTTAGAVTTNAYSGLILLKVSGTGQSAGASLNDAFYFNIPDNPTHEPDFFQLATTIGATVFAFPINPNTAYRHIVYDVDAGLAVTPPYVPPFRANNVYTFIINMNTLVPAPTGASVLRLGVSDGFVIDNSGAYTVQVTRLCEGCGNKGNKALICHKGREICISQEDVEDHLNHGDVFGHCPVATAPPVEARSGITERRNDLPGNFRVFVSPNPVSVTTTIFYELPFDSRVTVKVYDVLGKEIITLADAYRKAGCHSTPFNVSALQKGLYFYRTTVKTKNKVWMQTGKISVVK